MRYMNLAWERSHMSTRNFCKNRKITVRRHICAGHRLESVPTYTQSLRFRDVGSLQCKRIWPIRSGSASTLRVVSKRCRSTTQDLRKRCLNITQLRSAALAVPAAFSGACCVSRTQFRSAAFRGGHYSAALRDPFAHVLRLLCEHRGHHAGDRLFDHCAK